MPWVPDLFGADALAQILAQRGTDHVKAVPFFAGLMTGDMDALLDSFAGEPELHHPVRGRVKGAGAFTRFVAETRAWLDERHVTVEAVDEILTPRRGVEEVVLHLDGEDGRVDLPVALADDRDERDRIVELRMYFSRWPLSGRHASRPPLLQPDPDAHPGGVVGDYQRALAAGDADAVVAAFAPDGYVREPAGGAHVHRGTGELRALFELFFSNGGGLPLEHCTVTDDGRSCALEYNVVRWGRTELAPEAGLAVYERGAGGKLAAARIYDDVDPPVG